MRWKCSGGPPGWSISTAPGPIFSPGRGFSRCLRLNYGHPLDAPVDSALVTLGRLAAGAAR